MHRFTALLSEARIRGCGHADARSTKYKLSYTVTAKTDEAIHCLSFFYEHR
jgi:hypothetical protein